MVVVPATVNTTNKWAYGSSDTLALGLLNEAIGLGLPIVAVPNPSTALVDPMSTHTQHGTDRRRLVPWEALTEEVRTIRRGLR